MIELHPGLGVPTPTAASHRGHPGEPVDQPRSGAEVHPPGLWISRGRLKAMRAGQRKLLVRRSELDRMLALTDPSRAAPQQPRMPEPLRPVFSRPLMGQVARARANMDPAVIREAIKKMQEAEAVFETAVGASDNAPPDPDFPLRLRAVAEASLQRAEALIQASLIPGFRWTPVSEPDSLIRSHELRPGGNRPGPAQKWQSYDRLSSGCPSPFRETSSAS